MESVFLLRLVDIWRDAFYDKCIKRDRNGDYMAEGLARHKLEQICNAWIFSQVDEIVVEQIVSDRRCECRRFSRGEIIYDETHFQRCLGILLVGRVRVEKRIHAGKLMKMSMLQPGDCFGAAAMFQDQARYATVLTAEDSIEVLFLPEEVLRWAMRRNYIITENYIRYLSNQIWVLNKKISELTAGTAEQRLAGFLAEHCEANGQLQSSMTVLSRQLNVGRATLYRAAEALEKKGIIIQGSKSIQILDMERLRQVSTSQ